MSPESQRGASLPTRRDFLKKSASVSMAAIAAPLASRSVFAAGSDTLRVGLIGCGGRGTGAARDCVESTPGVRITAMGDLFEDRLQASLGSLSELGSKLDVPPARRFVGFDAYEKVIASDVDLVILATPPGFRPQHLRAAVNAGKHVFAEKPIAVDPAGVRSVLESAQKGEEKGLGIVAGTQRRHQDAYRETLSRIHDGAIGELVGGQCYWNQGGLWAKRKEPSYSDVEWQIRNWLYFTWLSGDHIVEQHVHNIDVMNWAFQSTPVKALGMGGRQVRTDPIYGHIFDHFAIEFEYPGGVRVLSMCRQIEGTDSRIGEHLVGTRGTADPAGRIDGESRFRFDHRTEPNPYVQEHSDLIASIRSNSPLNEAKRIAESTLTAIMGRMSAYTGKVVTWEQALSSKLELVPHELGFGPRVVPPVAVPGKTPLI